MKRNKGISLIVLVITIIVIIILASIILVSVSKTNPIKKANKAKYESDRDNMQSIFTNVVGYIMAENEGTLNITPTQLNNVTTGANEAIGEVTYTITDASNIENTTGKIIFDKGEDTNTEFYTGKKLPIYAAGETKWYVDSEGIISLEVAGAKYGSGESPGLYDENDNLIATWDELVNKYGLNVETNYAGHNVEGTMYYVLTKNSNLSGGTKLIIPNGITKIGQRVFQLCELESIILPNTVTSIGNRAFNECRNLGAITIPESVIDIQSRAFQRCSSITSITIPKSVKTIEAYAFNDNEQLQNVTFKNSGWELSDGTDIDVSNTSMNATYIKSTYINQDWFNVTESGLYDESGKQLKTWQELLDEGSIVVENGVLRGGKFKQVSNIQYYQYSGDAGILVVDTSVKSIRENAFGSIDSGSPNLIKVVLQHSVKTIGNYAFGECSKLTNIEFGKGLTSIGDNAFYRCYALESIVIPKNVTSVGSTAFMYCRNVSSITLESTSTKYSYGVFRYIDKELTSVVIPDGMSSIPEWMFMECSNLKTVTIPTSVTYIAAAAFEESGISEIYYSGTKAQWSDVGKYTSTRIQYWNNGCGKITVHCTDGDITIAACPYATDLI